MYIPDVFQETDLATLHRTMREAGLATLVTATSERMIASPVPLFLVAEEGPYGTLYGHLARANPQRKLTPIGDALVLFMGPNAYISPSWYPSKQEHGKVVPTWNYLAVHAYGQVEFFDDADRLRCIVSQLTDLHEKQHAQPWSVGDAPDIFVNAMLRGIVGLRMQITHLEGKLKMNQDETAEDRAGAIQGLAKSEHESAHAVSALIPR